MSEQEQVSQLSALFDGELPSQQAQMVIRRALRDSAMRERWQRYALIGACVRGEPLAAAGSRGGVAERVAARLADEADILAPGAAAGAAQVAMPARSRRSLGRGIVGGAIAAGVALMAVVVVRSMAPAGADPGTLVAQSGPAGNVAVEAVQVAAPAVQEPAPRSYTTPVQNSATANPMGDQQPLAHYVVAHSEQAASAFGFSYDLTQGAIDMTEAEIAAHR
jgi:negative regulator of sigma E activity